MAEHVSKDPIFQQLSGAVDLLGLFSMNQNADVLESIGEFAGQSAELHAPVIHSILLDAKGVLDTSPFVKGARGREPMKRIVLTYKSFTLSIVRVQDIVYVIKALNIADEGDEGEQ